MPLTIVQITDPHIGSEWGDGGGAALDAVIDSVHGVLRRAPDAVVVSGDIANSPTDDEYADARARLERLAAPLYLLPGNHDDRAGMRRIFDLGDDGDGHLSFAVNLGPVRIVGLDTKRPGEDLGQFDAERRSWLEQVLAEGPPTPTLLVMHHPPLTTGVPAIDSIALPEAERAELQSVLSRHDEVQLISAGHVHRAIFGRLGSIPVLAIPSTDIQLALDFDDPELRLVREPPCFAVHVLVDGRLVSHLQPVS